MRDRYERALADLDGMGRLRRLSPAAGHDFASNDYLGLAGSPELKQAATDALARGVPVGAGASRLLRGNHTEHEALEAEAARLFGAETALFFASGFLANAAIFATLPQRGDVVVHDELVHASAHDGLRMGRAEPVSVRHNDANAFDEAIARWRVAGGTGCPWIAVESLYSMDGDRAPLDALMAIADRHDGMLVIDEAHATGVLGPQGRGLGAHLEGRRNVVSLHTCGKALGAVGALVCAPRSMRDFMVNRGRGFVFATAPSPLMAAVVRAALASCTTAPERRQRLAALVNHAGQSLTQHTGLAPSGTQIIPVIVGEDTRAVELAGRLQARGFDVRAIRPPTVPEGTSRLRISITLNTTVDVVGDLMRALGEEMASQR